MATYAIGDLQGCYKPFQQLLDLIGFNSANDRLWLVGDIVNRGHDSLSLLRFLKQAGDSVKIVLGNHDLHLLMVAAGLARTNPSDTLQAVLQAPDRDELLHWLRHQALLHVEEEYVMVHAGLLPTWSIVQAQQLAQEAETELHQENFQAVFAQLYGNQPDHWDESLKGYERLRVIVNAMTRMRVCTPEGKINFSFKGSEQDIPAGYLPWFEAPNRASQEATIICGHWSALGLKIQQNLIALDTGCLWGGSLTAVRLEDRKIFQVPCVPREATMR
ncbi:MAG: symmetrical bis(5'-nucleosyl)-tetraphosphatase [Nitrosomonas sp.]|nr:symmetrical bis(5'-nucleosyl)-tetraphosphatase [Nitrosomonas sp.]MDP1951813.1 symmetrical bis(5'-nucleosyl)-tetraphosphatase [Nitrosomonas sp.]